MRIYEIIRPIPHFIYNNYKLLYKLNNVSKFINAIVG